VISTLPELSDKAVKMVPDEREDKFLKSQEENSIKTAKIN
jgi:hypothetical protein